MVKGQSEASESTAIRLLPVQQSRITKSRLGQTIILTFFFFFTMNYCSSHIYIYMYVFNFGLHAMETQNYFYFILDLFTLHLGCLTCLNIPTIKLMIIKRVHKKWEHSVSQPHGGNI